MKLKYCSVKRKESLNLSNFPNFHKAGSIAGMKKLYYGKNALLVQSGDYIYNVDEQTYNNI